MVEPWSPIALPDALAAASCGFSAVGLTRLRWFQAQIDWGQSIYHTPGSMVEPLSPIALPDALAAASCRFFGYWLYRVAVASDADRLGTIDLPYASIPGRAIVPNGSTRLASGGVLRFFGCWSYRVEVASGADRLGTIDLPYASIHGRAIVPNGSTRRASGGIFWFFGCWSYRVAVASGADRLGTIDLPYASGGFFELNVSFSAFLSLRSRGFTRPLALDRTFTESLLRSLGPAPRTLPILRTNTTTGSRWAPLLVMH